MSTGARAGLSTPGAWMTPRWKKDISALRTLSIDLGQLLADSYLDEFYALREPVLERRDVFRRVAPAMAGGSRHRRGKET